MSKLQPLPIDEYILAIVEHLRQSYALVLKAEPGAGKTTRVPAAMLDAGLAKLVDGKQGQIVVLQPRRVAARAAATRIANERGSVLGDEIGYQVRFERRASKNTKILVCTEGIFLRQLQDDPLLSDKAAVIFDEFHERSVDSDLALAMVRQVCQTVRPDLRVVVMSATLDTGQISRFLAGCPVIECPGRTYPVSIQFLASPAKQNIEQLIVSGIKQILPEADGHILAFLPGVAEIRQVQNELSMDASLANVLLLPLYGDMPLDEQQQVLLPAKLRKIVLATNVAETSITIDGVKCVIDSGLRRVNKLDQRLGLNKLEITRISKASAAQRAGRAGRTEAGMCLRLWTEREHSMLDDFDLPEIYRVDLSQVFLQLFAWGESDVKQFAWLEAPSAVASDQALQLLERLDALHGGKLTELGRAMSALPLQTRTARLLLAGQSSGFGERAALCAALLEERDPFLRSPEKRAASHYSYSDLLDRLEALEHFAQTGNRLSTSGELSKNVANQVLRAAEQVGKYLPDLADKNKRPVGGPVNKECNVAILRAIVAALPDRLCKRRAPHDRRALMVGGRGVRLADESAVGDADLFVAVELMDSGQAESLVRQASRADIDWLPPRHMSERTETYFDRDKQRVLATRRLRFFDLLIDERPVAVPSGQDVSAILAEAIACHVDIDTLISEEAQRYLQRINWLKEVMPEWELPDFGQSPWLGILPEWTSGCSSVSDLKAVPLVSILQSRLTPVQIAAVEKHAPDYLVVPSGRRVKLDYKSGKSPVLAARIQEMFGLPATPVVAKKIPVIIHLLAPNNRVQQITSDLASFWKNTYAEVKKDLKARYPKHAWPDDPLKAQPQSKLQRR